MKKHLVPLLALLALSAQAQDFSRSALPTDRETPDFVLGTAKERWTGGRVDWYYNPANQPGNLTTENVVNAMKTAASRWVGMCNLSFNYMGLTTVVPNVRSTSTTVDRINVFGWGMLTDDQAKYGAYTQWWRNGNAAIFDADVVINTAFPWSLQNVETIMTHELGHVIGLNHSDLQASVMFANPYNSYEFQRTLRGDDANACAALYTASVDADSNRALNWAEQTFPQLLSPHPVPSGAFDGYNYRYYQNTDTYVGTKNGSAYLMGTDKVIRDQGKLSDFSNQVRAAGF